MFWWLHCDRRNWRVRGVNYQFTSDAPGDAGRRIRYSCGGQLRYGRNDDHRRYFEFSLDLTGGQFQLKRSKRDNPLRYDAIGLVVNDQLYIRGRSHQRMGSLGLRERQFTFFSLLCTRPMTRGDVLRSRQVVMRQDRMFLLTSISIIAAHRSLFNCMRCKGVMLLIRELLIRG